MVAVLSFTRVVQRLFEQTWELPPLSVCNTLNGLRVDRRPRAYIALSGLAHGRLDRTALELAARRSWCR